MILILVILIILILLILMPKLGDTPAYTIHTLYLLYLFMCMLPITCSNGFSVRHFICRNRTHEIHITLAQHKRLAVHHFRSLNLEVKRPLDVSVTFRVVIATCS